MSTQTVVVCLDTCRTISILKTNTFHFDFGLEISAVCALMQLVTKIARCPPTHVAPVGRRPICRYSSAIGFCFFFSSREAHIWFGLCCNCSAISVLHRFLLFVFNLLSKLSSSLGHMTDFLATLSIVSLCFSAFDGVFSW